MKYLNAKTINPMHIPMKATLLEEERKNKYRYFKVYLPRPSRNDPEEFDC